MTDDDQMSPRTV